ncbi:type II toxin-antitoxin system VapC family toxin [soil metagenome]
MSPIPARSTVLLDSHVLHWWSAEPARLSPTAARALEAAETLAVASITWFELAWLAHRGRIILSVPLRSWLDGLAEQVRSVPLSPAIAAAAASLPATFPGDPADRIIYATGIEHGWRVVTKDARLRRHPFPRSMTVW